MAQSPMQKAWRYYNAIRFFYGREYAKPFDRAVFAQCLHDAHKMTQFARRRDAGEFMPSSRIEAIENELARLDYAPFGVRIADKRRELEAEKASLIAQSHPETQQKAA